MPMHSLAWTLAARINREKKSEILVFGRKGGSVEYMPMHSLTWAFAARINKTKIEKLIIALY